MPSVLWRCSGCSWSGHNLFRHVTFSGCLLHPLVSIRPLGSNPVPPLLNFWTVPLHTTHWLALPVMAQPRSYPLAVAQLSSFANLSRNYPLPFQTFHRSSHLLSLCNFLIRSYQSSIYIVLHPRPLIPNHSLFSSMTSVLFSRLLQPLPMNLSSPVTSTFISIIL